MFPTVCRVCVGKNANASLFDLGASLNYAEKIMACTNLQIHLDDDLPSFICDSCIAKLESAYEFKTICETSDFEMRQMITLSIKKEDINDGIGSLPSMLAIKIEGENDDHDYGTSFDNTSQDSDVKDGLESESTEILSESSKKYKQKDEIDKKKRTRYTKQDTTLFTIDNDDTHPDSTSPLLAETKPKKKVVEKGPFKCEDCGRVCPTLSCYKLHLRVHTGERPYKCEYCPATFAIKSTLQVHTRMHTGEKPYTCHECGSSFRHKSHLTNHSRTHTGIKPHACPHCPKSFTQKGKLTIHITMHTKEKPFICSFCGRAFACKVYLTDHHKTHTKEKRYKCKICEKNFSSTSSLAVHMRVHTGEKPYECDICQKSFTQLDGLNVHKNRHFGLRPHICECCDKSFYCKGHLKRHKRLHDKRSADQQKCEVCKTWVSNIDKHTSLHRTDKKFSCDVCKKKFNWSQGLSRHIRKFHKADVSLQGNAGTSTLTDQSTKTDAKGNVSDGLQLSKRGKKKLTKK